MSCKRSTACGLYLCEVNVSLCELVVQFCGELTLASCLLCPLVVQQLLCPDGKFGIQLLILHIIVVGVVVEGVSQISEWSM